MVERLPRSKRATTNSVRKKRVNYLYNHALVPTYKLV